MKIRTRAIFLCSFLLGLTLASEAYAGTTPVRSVILIVSDGHGASMQEATRLVRGRLAVDAMNATSMRTMAEGNELTDSAASATAMATGRKTKNRYIGVDAGDKPLETVAERASAAGKQIGFVTTSFLWDATPAGFAAHVTDRDHTDIITRDFLRLRPNVLFGGGEGYLLPAGAMGRWGPGLRADGINMLREFKAAGYAEVTTPTAKGSHILGLFGHKEMFTEKPSFYAPSVSLPAMSAGALERLSHSPNGFFLVIEEEGTDEMLHGGNVKDALVASMRWDDTVALVLAYAKTHPGTVVIATSDHESGGVMVAAPQTCDAPLNLIDESTFNKKYAPAMESTRQLIKTPEGQSFCVRAWTNRHTATPVPLYTQGVTAPGKTVHNTYVYDLIVMGLGLK